MAHDRRVGQGADIRAEGETQRTLSGGGVLVPVAAAPMCTLSAFWRSARSPIARISMACSRAQVGDGCGAVGGEAAHERGAERDERGGRHRPEVDDERRAPGALELDPASANAAEMVKKLAAKP